ncbi:hypothetical protein MPL3356_60629 [Mesorhizobium plurifarium]|uniref:Uncharacterized protein n=1 Tax=Mesorhizobium plurifarium TaxID=69974 RepID=A0A090EAE0_MESPL|nr:hypothetical protein MPL3356_60629 [Mesorhizobium plurifarium]
MPITNQQRRVLKQMLEKEREGIERGHRQHGVEVPEQIVKAIIAENFVRASLEVVVEELIPFNLRFIGELAIRISSLVISAAPIEKQEELIAIVGQSLKAAHFPRVADGQVIRTKWETAGRMQPNVATGNEVN